MDNWRSRYYHRSARGNSILIEGAVIAKRTNIGVTRAAAGQGATADSLGIAIVPEGHMVVGLRPKGMQQIAYVWAKQRGTNSNEGTTFLDARTTGLKDDIPSPSLVLPLDNLKLGSSTLLTIQRSLVQAPQGGTCYGCQETCGLSGCLCISRLVHMCL